MIESVPDVSVAQVLIQEKSEGLTLELDIGADGSPSPWGSAEIDSVAKSSITIPMTSAMVVAALRCFAIEHSISPPKGSLQEGYPREAVTLLC